MKTVICYAAISLLLTSCDQQNNKSTDNVATSAIQDSSLIEDNPSLTEDTSNITFLLTDSSAGYFSLGQTWQDIAKKEYNYQSKQVYGRCTDACCDGGFQLGINKGEEGFIDNPTLLIGAAKFDDSKSKNKHSNNPNVFFIDSDNCSSWYHKDKIDYILVFGDRFRTKEGIGVGSTLEQIQEQFGKLSFYVGWIEEDPNALKVILSTYPNISFILDVEDYLGDREAISLTQENNSLTLADFKKHTKIQHLIIQKAELE